MSNIGSSNVGQYATSNNHWMLSTGKMLWGIQGGWISILPDCTWPLHEWKEGKNNARTISSAFQVAPISSSYTGSSLSALWSNKFISAGMKWFCCKAINVLSHVFVSLRKPFPDASPICRPVAPLNLGSSMWKTSYPRISHPQLC